MVTAPAARCLCQRRFFRGPAEAARHARDLRHVAHKYGADERPLEVLVTAATRAHDGFLAPDDAVRDAKPLVREDGGPMILWSAGVHPGADPRARRPGPRLRRAAADRVLPRRRDPRAGRRVVHAHDRAPAGPRRRHLAGLVERGRGAHDRRRLRRVARARRTPARREGAPRRADRPGDGAGARPPDRAGRPGGRDVPRQLGAGRLPSRPPPTSRCWSGSASAGPTGRRSRR